MKLCKYENSSHISINLDAILDEAASICEKGEKVQAN